MRKNPRSMWRHPTSFAVCALIVAGCQATRPAADATASQRPGPSARSPRVVQDTEEIPKIEGPDPAEPVGPVTSSLQDLRLNRQAITYQIPDPVQELARLPELIATTQPAHKEFYRDELKRIQSALLPRQVKLSLKDCIHKALRNNYAARSSGYGPAIETTRVVEAEAQFDAVYFLNLNYNSQDRPSSSELQGTFSDVRTFGTGVRKLLSTGSQVQISYATTRTFTDLVFQTLNPAYFNQLIFELRQPFLRGFGLDYNRAQIELSKLDRRISLEQFSKDLQQTLFSVEQAYWQLKQARGAVVVAARELAAFDGIYNIIENRKGFDTYLIQLGQIQSRLQTREADFISRKANVRNAEDALKALMDDPDLNMAMAVEIIPTDEFTLNPVLLDRLGEVQAALDYRPELRQAKLQIEKARVAIGAAKNQALPKFDVVFRYVVDGLGADWSKAFKEMSHNDYNEYYVGVEFEWPIGNRGPEAALRRARLQQAQAITNQRAQIEQIINEVHRAVRDVEVSYEQLPSTLRAAQASEDQLRATIARQLAKDPANLEVELNATESLAGSRDNLVSILGNYNISIVSLEQKKGTLLKYNNIELRDPDAGRPMAADWVPAPTSQPQ
jgi:outer membrane protein